MDKFLTIGLIAFGFYLLSKIVTEQQRTVITTTPPTTQPTIKPPTTQPTIIQPTQPTRPIGGGGGGGGGSAPRMQPAHSHCEWHYVYIGGGQWSIQHVCVGEDGHRPPNVN